LNILLIAPPRKVPQKTDFPPIGLAYISAYLKKDGIHSAIIDAGPLSWKKLAKIVSEKAPALVGITCWTQERGQAFKTAELVKSIFPETKIIFGGHHATAFPRNMLIQTSADAVVIGEGEETTLELVRAMLEGCNLGMVKGIAYRHKGDILYTEPRDFIEDLDTIPYPSYSDYHLDDYLGIPDVKGPAASLMTSRGCPYNCVFCSAGNFWKRKWRARSPGNVLGEIEWLYHDYNVHNFAFFDDNFTVNKTRAIEICRGILDRHLKINWVASSHVNHIDEELLQWMSKSGCFRIDFGIESGSPKILKNIKKGQTAAQIEKTFSLVHNAGIKPRAYLLIGCPGETEETVDETIKLMKKIRPYYSRTAEILIVFPGTQLCETAKQQGLLNDNYWLQTNETLHYTAEHSYEALKILKEHLMKGMAKNEGTFKAMIEYWARRVYYNHDILQKLRHFRRVFN
jgi:anaerobic magnesium-protoporphyrin IX monomethyl ester cyclase